MVQLTLAAPLLPLSHFVISGTPLRRAWSLGSASNAISQRTPRSRSSPSDGRSWPICASPHLEGKCYRWEGIPMVKDELVASLLIGTMVMFVFALVWGRELVDLIGRLI